MLDILYSLLNGTIEIYILYFLAKESQQKILRRYHDMYFFFPICSIGII